MEKQYPCSNLYRGRLRARMPTKKTADRLDSKSKSSWLQETPQLKGIRNTGSKPRNVSEKVTDRQKELLWDNLSEYRTFISALTSLQHFK